MTAIPATFRAFVAEKVDGDGARVERGVREFAEADLPPGEVEIRVDWSSVNYKDGLATRADGKVARISPLIPGIDLAGEVVASADPAISVGDGGARPRLRPGRRPATAATPSTSACRPAGSCRWRPGLTPRDAMAIGTAGFTAAMSVVALEERGLQPDDGPVLVTGASGGVGGTALAILADRGYEVWAATGKTDEAARLRALGAAGILTRDEVTAEGRPLESERWAGAVDAVGARDAALRPADASDRGGGRRVRERRRGRAHDDGLPVHPARGRPARDGLGDDADRAAARHCGIGSATDLRPRDLGVHATEVDAGHARTRARRDPGRVGARSLDRQGGGLARAPDAQSSSPRSCSRARSSGRRTSSAGCSGNGVCETASSSVDLAGMDAPGQHRQRRDRRRLRIGEARAGVVAMARHDHRLGQLRDAIGGLRPIERIAVAEPGDRAVLQQVAGEQDARPRHADDHIVVRVATPQVAQLDRAGRRDRGSPSRRTSGPEGR